jgi:tetratricopeptide (TPR) repeat protein
VQHPSRSSAQPVMTVRQRRVCGTIDKLVQADNSLGLAAMAPEAQAVAGELRAARHPNAAAIYNNLGNCFESLGQYAKAVELHEQHRAIAEEDGDRAGQGTATSGSATPRWDSTSRPSSCTSSIGRLRRR